MHGTDTPMFTDKLMLLEPSSLVREHVALDEVDSTNRYALDARRSGLLVTAEVQTAGRGRRGHVWESPRGRNLYLSLTVEGLDPRLTILAGVAVRESVAALIGGREDLLIKWPNDILVGSRKLCGILCEARGNLTAVGIGLNVNQRSWSAELEDVATSLALCVGEELDRSAVLRQVVSTLECWHQRYVHEGFAPVRAAFLTRNLAVNHAASLEDGTLCVIRDMDESGQLIVEVNGQLRTIISGEIRLQR